MNWNQRATVRKWNTEIAFLLLLTFFPLNYCVTEALNYTGLIGAAEEPATQPEETAAPVETEKPRFVLTQGEKKELTAYLEEQNGSWSLYLLDLDSGKEFCYNQELAYYPASLLKVPYAFWLATLADEGKLDLDSTVPNVKYGSLTEDDLAQYNEEKEIPVKAVLHSMLAWSDNDAVTLLSRSWPGNEATGFTEFLTSLGYAYPGTIEVSSTGDLHGMMTVEDAGKTMKALYEYFQSDSPNAQFLKECMTAAEHDVLYIPEGVAAAKKYGSWDGAYHDIAIVYNEHPYILCVMSDNGNTQEDFPEAPTQVMQEIGKMVNRITNGG